MAENPIPLPPEAVPSDAPAWLSPDADRWRALAPGRWAHPFPAVLALALACLAALRLAGDDAYVCDDAGACTADWLGTVMAALMFTVLYRGIWRLPLPTAVILPVLTLWVLLDPDTPTAAGVAVAVGACYAWLGCVRRLAAARRQRQLALEIAGPGRYPLPEAATTIRADGDQLGCGIVVGVVALLGLAVGTLGSTPFMDAGSWQAIAVVGTVAGCLSMAHYVRDRHGAVALRRGPLPALRVLVREGGGHNDRRTYVFPADDLDGRRPVLGCYTRLAGREFRAPVHNRLREAVLFGPPHPGGGLVLVSSDGQETPRLCVEYATASARQEPPTGLPEQPEPGAAPVSWGPGTGNRLFALVLEAAVISVVAALSVHSGVVPFPARVFLAFLVLGGTYYIATQFSWRVTADGSGLWVVRMRRVKHVPWSELSHVWLRDRGFNIQYSAGGDRSIEVYGVVAASWLNRRFRRRPEALRAVDGIRAMQADPALRPTEESAPEDRGRPVGVPLLVIHAVAALALLVYG
ncbi:hypothetical protein ABT009_03085 [Streptomyces sp. NPDC002896]|uniref:hypothetical protein n=1 Tax=Streptomyces sp. NPDC002896 TaxID=3154438 RepID=UPI003321D0E5